MDLKDFNTDSIQELQKIIALAQETASEQLANMSDEDQQKVNDIVNSVDLNNIVEVERKIEDLKKTQESQESQDTTKENK